VGGLLWKLTPTLPANLPGQQWDPDFPAVWFKRKRNRGFDTRCLRGDDMIHENRWELRRRSMGARYSLVAYDRSGML
jgi:hypothetical protein